jgi:Fur family ferric uptake transcriptional regulator
MLEEERVERRTQQRDVLWDVIRSAGRPLSAREMLDSGKRRIKRLGLATVYRTINRWVEEGRLVPVEIPGQGTRYEQAGLQHHHHFYCRGCDKVYELEGCPLSAAVKAPRGFDVETHEVTLFGRCAGCSR